ncbi:MAG: hypothetical protein EAZ42_04325 [Verrucomicrobia bacterium]|nr:MAG: hypothetical protein EAZ42_04325 [Verrucomicrobiota bacterium]
MENVTIEKILVTWLISLTVSIGYYRFKSNTSASDSKSILEFTISHISKIHEPNINAAPRSTVNDDDIYSEIQAANLIDNDKNRVQTLKRIAGRWSLKDPASCLEWALSIANEKIGNEYIAAQVFMTLVSNDQFGKAMELLSQVPQGNLRDTSIGYGMWGILDPDRINLAESEQILYIINFKCLKL